MGEPMIQLIDLHKSFGDNRVLQGVNLTIERGETMVIIGGSGSGKSVILKHIIGLMKPDRGKVIVVGQDLSALRERALDELRKKFGMLFQYAALFDSLNVHENVAMGLPEGAAKDIGQDEVLRRVVRSLEMVNLDPSVVLAKLPAELSGGMRKRVGIARAIALRPRYILYDEPTTGLDPVTSAVIDRLMVRTREHLGVTGVVVTHDMRSAYTVGDRIAMLYEGRIRQVGTVAEIQETEDPVVRQFIEGRPE